MSGGGSQPTQTQTTEPPKYLGPYLKETASEAQKIYNSGGPAYFPGQTVAPFTAAQNLGLTAATNLATQGGNLTPAANSQLLSTINGNGVNPYLADAVKAANAPLFEQFQQETIPTLNSIFARAGGTGGSAEGFAAERAATALGRGVSENAANLAYQSAAQERQNQLNAVALAPQLDAARYADANQLLNIGGIQQGQNQQDIQAAIDKYNYEQNLPALRLNQYIQQLQGGNSGGIRTTTTAQPPGNSTLSLLGGAGAGAAAGSIFGPPGMIQGAILGGLAGRQGWF